MFIAFYCRFYILSVISILIIKLLSGKSPTIKKLISRLTLNLLQLKVNIKGYYQVNLLQLKKLIIIKSRKKMGNEKCRSIEFKKRIPKLIKKFINKI